MPATDKQYLGEGKLISNRLLSLSIDSHIERMSDETGDKQVLPPGRICTMWIYTVSQKTSKIIFVIIIMPNLHQI